MSSDSGFYAAAGSTTIAPSALHDDDMSSSRQFEQQLTEDENINTNSGGGELNGTTMQFANKRRRKMMQKQFCYIAAEAAVYECEKNMLPLLQEAVEAHRRITLMIDTWDKSNCTKLMWEEMRLGLKFFHDIENKIEQAQFANCNYAVKNCISYWSTIQPENIVVEDVQAEETVPLPPSKRKQQQKRKAGGSLAQQE